MPFCIFCSSCFPTLCLPSCCTFNLEDSGTSLEFFNLSERRTCSDDRSRNICDSLAGVFTVHSSEGFLPGEVHKRSRTEACRRPEAVVVLALPHR